MTEGSQGETRDVWVLGFRDSDERPEKALGRVFGIDSVRARRLIASMPAVVKREVTAEQAEPIVAALRKIGARVALVPSGASSPPGASPAAKVAPAPAKIPEAPAPAPDSLGLGDIESAAIDFGTSGPPSSGSHAPFRDSLPYPARSSSMPPREPAKVSVAPPKPKPEHPAPAPVTFLDPRPIPEEPTTPPEKGALGTALLAIAIAAAGGGGLYFASTLPGSLFGGAPDVVGAIAASAAIALLLFGLQALVGALGFGVSISKAGAIAFAVVGAGAVGATGFFLHQVDPAEVARQERAATMTAIREGRLPEARLFLTEPGSTLEGMERAAASEWVEALYAAGARHVYVLVDYEADAHTGSGVAISLPVTQSRRAAVASAVRQRVPAPPADDGEWWLIPFE